MPKPETRVAGQRIDPNKFGFLRLPPGGYGMDLQRRWWVRPPGADAYIVEPEVVTEHADRTISVSGSVNGSGVKLELGEWRLP